MSISSSTSKVQYTLTSTGQILSVPFYFLEDSHLKVIRTTSAGAKTTLVLNVGYTIDGAGNENGGTITMNASYGNSGDTITILRQVPATQLLDYVYNDAFPAQSHERGLDKLTMLLQEQGEILDRTLRVPEDDAAIEELPGSEDRKNKLLGFNVLTGQPEPVDKDTYVANIYNITGDQVVIGDVGTLQSSDLSALAVGATVTLTGYYSTGDFGEPIVGHINTVSAGVISHLLADGRYWNFFAKGIVLAEWFGAIGNGSADDRIALQGAIDAVVANSLQGVALSPGKTYAIETYQTGLSTDSTIPTPKYGLHIPDTAKPFFFGTLEGSSYGGPSGGLRYTGTEFIDALLYISTAGVSTTQDFRTIRNLNLITGSGYTYKSRYCLWANARNTANCEFKNLTGQYAKEACFRFDGTIVCTLDGIRARHPGYDGIRINAITSTACTNFRVEYARRRAIYFENGGLYSFLKGGVVERFEAPTNPAWNWNGSEPPFLEFAEITAADFRAEAAGYGTSVYINGGRNFEVSNVGNEGGGPRFLFWGRGNRADKDYTTDHCKLTAKSCEVQCLPYLSFEKVGTINSCSSGTTASIVTAADYSGTLNVGDVIRIGKRVGANDGTGTAPGSVGAQYGPDDFMNVDHGTTAGGTTKGYWYGAEFLITAISGANITATRKPFIGSFNRPFIRNWPGGVANVFAGGEYIQRVNYTHVPLVENLSAYASLAIENWFIKGQSGSNVGGVSRSVPMPPLTNRSNSKDRLLANTLFKYCFVDYYRDPELLGNNPEVVNEETNMLVGFDTDTKRSDMDVRGTVLEPRKSSLLTSSGYVTGQGGLDFGTADFSVCFGLYRDDIRPSSESIIWESHDLATSEDDRLAFFIEARSGQNNPWKLSFRNTTTTTEYDITPYRPLLSKTLYNVAITVDRDGYAKLYINGLLERKVSVSGTSAVNIGNTHTGAYTLQAGLAGPVIAYSRVLEDYEVRQINDHGQLLADKASQLTGCMLWLKMDEPAGYFVKDSSGNALHGLGSASGFVHLNTGDTGSVESAAVDASSAALLFADNYSNYTADWTTPGDEDGWLAASFSAFTQIAADGDGAGVPPADGIKLVSASEDRIRFVVPPLTAYASGAGTYSIRFTAYVPVGSLLAGLPVEGYHATAQHRMESVFPATWQEGTQEYVGLIRYDGSSSLTYLGTYIRPWETTTEYEAGDTIVDGGVLYRCLYDHTSGSGVIGDDTVEINTGTEEEPVLEDVTPWETLGSFVGTTAYLTAWVSEYGTPNLLPDNAVVTGVIVDGQYLPVEVAQTLTYKFIRLNPDTLDLQVQRSNGSSHTTLATFTPASLADVDVKVIYSIL